MNRCYLSLGSNLQSPQRQLRLALAALRKLPNTCVMKVASFYSNKAIGRKSQPDFYNTVVLIATRLPPHQLLNALQTIEKKQGRVRRVRWGSRTLDIDILLYDACQITSKRLTIPHPHMRARDFVMRPFFEISADIASRTELS